MEENLLKIIETRMTPRGRYCHVKPQAFIPRYFDIIDMVRDEYGDRSIIWDGQHSRLWVHVDALGDFEEYMRRECEGDDLSNLFE